MTPLIPPRLAATSALLLACLGSLGAAPCAAQAPPDSAATQATAPPARVFGSIEVAGNTRTAAAVILRELGFAAGEPFAPKKVELAWDRLEDLGAFAFVDIELEEEEDADGTVVVMVTITVEEEQTLHWYPLIDYSRRHKYRLGGRVQEGNFRGRGEKIAAEATAIRVLGARASWERPWLANRSWLAGGLGAGWERAEFVYRPTKYTTWDAGGHLRALLPGSLYLDAAGTFMGFRQHSDVVEHAPDRGDDLAADLLWTHGWRNRFTLGLTLGRDTRDLEFYPTGGAWHRIIARRAISDGFDSYSEVIGDLRQFVPMPLHKVLALRAWGRRVSNAVPLEDRLWWGGPETIRGYRYASLEGEEGWLLSAEYRWPLFLMPISSEGHVIGIGVHLFWDAGDAWYDGGSPGSPLMSWGAGAHMNLSSLNLRFECARTREGENVFQFEDHFNF